MYLIPYLNVGATLQAPAQNILQILSEPNLLAINGKKRASSPGVEFPFPTLQGGGAESDKSRSRSGEFGIRLHFLPTITPWGTIRLHVTPEVKFATMQWPVRTGSTVPLCPPEKVDTEVELQSGRAMIAGLLDNQTTESLSKIPGLADILLLGKFFTSKTISKSNWSWW